MSQLPTISKTTKITTTQPKTNERLQFYNSLFGKGKSKLCENTGLQLLSSLNYSLQTFLYTCDLNWVLAMIEIDQVENIIDKFGQSLAKRKFIQVRTVVKNFCEDDTSKLKGFKLNDNNSDDELQPLYAILMYCHPNLNKSEKYIIKLMKRIKQQTNETVCVGIAKMNDWETFEQWKQRALKNIETAQNMNDEEAQNINGAFYSDIDVKFVNPTNDSDNDEKKQTQAEKQQKRFGRKKEFESKMQEISNNEDYNWMIAIVEIDDWDLFLISQNNNDHNNSDNNNQTMVTAEINKLEKEIFHLFGIYGNESENEPKYFGYKLNERSGQFGLVLYDSKDINKCVVPAHEIIETLKEEISMKYQYTLSIGCSRLIEDDLGMSDDWFERINTNLKQAKRNGGNQVCFGNNNGNGNNDGVDIEADLELDKINLDHEIEKKSLQAIEVC